MKERKLRCRDVGFERQSSGGLKSSGLLLALVSAFPFPVGAQTAKRDVRLGEIFVSTTKSALQNEDSPRAISVITKEDLQSQGAGGGIQEALGALPGVEFARTGGLGGQIVLRGFSSSTQRSMLAVDGDRFRGRSVLELNMIDPFSVERIEVIRGPASAIWGADAMNGVVNVITRRARVSRDAPFSLDAKIRGVEYNSVNNMHAGRAEVIGGGNGFDVQIGVNYRKADDYRTPKGMAENSRYESKGIDFRVGYSPTAKTHFELAGRYQDVTTGRAGGLGAAPGSPYLKVSEDPIKEKYLKLGVESREVGAWADTLDASFYVRKLETDIYQHNATSPTGALPANTAHPHIQADTPTVYGGRVNATKGIGDHLLAYGVDFYNENFNSRRARAYSTNTSTGVVVNPSMCPVSGTSMSVGAWCLMERGTEQTNIGVHINDDWQATQNLLLSGTLRFDMIKTVIDKNPIPNENPNVTQAIDAAGRTRTDRPVTGSLGGVWKFAPRWSAVANVSEGFLAPSGSMRATSSFGGSSPSLPAPGLKPERSTVAEVGVRYAAEDLRLNLTAYHSRYRDLIVYRKTGIFNGAGFELSQYENVASARIDGVEFDGQWRVAKPWLLRGAFTLTRGKDKTSGEPLEAIAPLTARISARYGVEGAPWHIEGVVRGAAKRTRIDPATERKRPGHLALDIFASADLGQMLDASFKHWKAVFGIQNVFNQTIRNPVVAENIRYSNQLVGNPLVEPGRSFMLRLVQDY
ncbi:MAG: TonB-dependent receptor [Candidatus Accumulibacter sp.]|jgi:hemoglobin/transferrin/lactoferrin receptor protein|nr:TonB-dependent receptor [Accumulibacter sp.]